MSRAEATRVTRSNLMRLSRRLEQVHKGAALLQKRRDALVLQLFARVRPSIAARRAVEQEAARAYRALVDALAGVGRDELAALAWPSRELRITRQEEAAAGGLAADRFAPATPLQRGAAARALLPGQFNPAVDPAAQAFERLLATVLAQAPEEFALRELGRVLTHTVRQVNVLQRRVAVDLARAQVQVRRTLDEREREEAVRLRRIAASARR
jgi:V/A-type H+/Na+-transporting ATPase subunit D